MQFSSTGTATVTRRPATDNAEVSLTATITDANGKNSTKTIKVTVLAEDDGDSGGDASLTRDQLEQMISDGEDVTSFNTSAITDMSDLLLDKEIEIWRTSSCPQPALSGCEITSLKAVGGMTTRRLLYPS